MLPTKKKARCAGFLYLLLVLAAPVRLIYIPAALFVKGDAAATAGNILAHETLFRVGIVSDLFSGTMILFVTLAFYGLFEHVGRRHAVRMVILGGILPAALYYVNAVNDMAALILVRGADFLAVFEKPQREALAMLFLQLHGKGVLAAEVLWGLWLFPLSRLVWKSRFLPRFLGVWLFLNGIAYLALSLSGLLFPQHGGRVAAFAFPAQLGEVAFMLWLLILGCREAAPPSAAETA